MKKFLSPISHSDHLSISQLMFWRFFVLFYLIFIVAWSIFDWGEPSWIFYLTHWTLITKIVYMVLVLVLTVKNFYVLQTNLHDVKDTILKNQNNSILEFLHQSSQTLQYVTVTFGVTVVFAFWMLLGMNDGNLAVMFCVFCVY